MKSYRVRLVEDAEHDLIDIYRYIAHHDSIERSDHVLEQLEKVCSRLAELLGRGHIPPELDRIGVNSYREVFFKPYRVIYEVIGREVYVHCILDGRRDLPSLLERRLLR